MDYKAKGHYPGEWKEIIFKEDLQLSLNDLDRHIETKGEHLYSQDVRYWHVDGSIVTVKCRGQVAEWTSDGKPKRIVGTHNDIPDLKEIQEKFEQTSRYKSEFLSNVSPELRSPLNNCSDTFGSLFKGKKIFQIFATDIHKNSINYSANRLFTENELAGLSDEMKEKYFTKNEDKFQVDSRIR